MVNAILILQKEKQKQQDNQGVFIQQPAQAALAV